MTLLETDDFTIDRRVSIPTVNSAGIPVSAPSVIGGITFDPHVKYNIYRYVKIDLFFFLLNLQIDGRVRSAKAFAIQTFFNTSVNGNTKRHNPAIEAWSSKVCSFFHNFLSSLTKINNNNKKGIGNIKR